MLPLAAPNALKIRKFQRKTSFLGGSEQRPHFGKGYATAPQSGPTPKITLKPRGFTSEYNCEIASNTREKCLHVRWN